MIALGHTSTGVIIGLGVAAATPAIPFWLSAGLAFIFGVASHYAFDWLPHGHYHMRFKNIGLGMFLTGLLDFLGVILLMLGLSWVSFGIGPTFWLVAIGILGAQAPDLWEIAGQLGLVPQWRWVRAHRHFHHKILHWHSHPVAPHVRFARPLYKSDVWQLAFAFIAIGLIISQ